jgi:hypothetical protein
VSLKILKPTPAKQKYPALVLTSFFPEKVGVYKKDVNQKGVH